MALTLEIVTPEARRSIPTPSTTVVIPTVEGEIGILPGHIPLLTQSRARRTPRQYEHLQSLIRYSGVQLAVKRRRR